MPRLSKIGAAALAAFGWTSGVSAVTASYLVVAGGGGGGAGISGVVEGGGGGAGGYRTSTASLDPTLSYTVTVGAGGTSNTNGSDSIFAATTSTGGGAGGRNGTTSGSTGGSGGGAGGVTVAGANGNTPSTSPSQGNNGGSGIGAPYYASAGGGGAGAVGGTAVTTPGAGGAGTANNITGSSVTYGGGGGGTQGGTTSGAGGAGGGGAGATSGNGNPGTANLGGGGGAGSSVGSGAGGNGGSGVVIISYAGAQQFGGGVVTSVGGNTIHTFNTSGTLSPITTLSASYLIVAGGGSGGFDTAGNAGGGGAGGLLSGSGLILDSNSIYTVTVGAGGTAPTAANSVGNDGSNSLFGAVSTSAVGGGGGGTYSNFNGRSGGSGGGGGQTSGVGGAATAGQGNVGGTNSSIAGSGGGGAGAVGVSSSTALGGNGGAGSASSISGSSVTYAGGGGGSNHGSAGSQGGLGGSGGGGNGHYGATAGQAGTANLGGGGGGGGETRAAGNGGSGVVIISYAGATQLMAGGTVTITGGNVIHTFNSSGYLTPLTLFTRSLRFRSSASAYLNRTPATTSNRTTWTWSGWIKRGGLSGTYGIFGAGTDNSASRTLFWFNSADKLIYQEGNTDLRTTAAVFRDPAAWGHLVVVVDNGNATAANRILIYWNGVLQTTTGTGDPGSTQMNLSSVAMKIGTRTNPPTSEFFDGYMTEINFIDGQALTPNSFGTINSYGVWQPITYGGSYGTNGFYLPFTNNASTTTLGYDFSPNGNNWTTNNISLTAGATYDSMTDVPTLTSATAANYAVLNPLDTSSNGTLSRANLQSTSVGVISGKASIAASAGKWYWEVTCTGGNFSGVGSHIGIDSVTSPCVSSAGTRLGNTATSYSYNSWNGQKLNNNTSSAYGSTYTNGDVISIALDLDNGKIWWAKNGTWQASGDPAAGTNAAYSSITAGLYTAAIGDDAGGGIVLDLNFGQQPFTYTPPSGFVALNTYNL